MDTPTIIAICAITGFIAIVFMALLYSAIRERGVPPDIDWEDGEDRQ